MHSCNMGPPGLPQQLRLSSGQPSSRGGPRRRGTASADTSLQLRIKIACGSRSSSSSRDAHSSSSPACRMRDLGSRSAQGMRCSLGHCPAEPARMTSRSEAASTMLHGTTLTLQLQTLEHQAKVMACCLQVVVKGVIYTKLELIGRGGSSKVYKVTSS
jgi:hypothetical protein